MYTNAPTSNSDQSCRISKTEAIPCPTGCTDDPNNYSARGSKVMELDITDEAVSWTVKRGGTAAIDFIAPIG